MKLKPFFILAFLMTGMAFNSLAQKSSKYQELNIKVSGCCGSCKERIEGALDLKGIRMADWNKETKNLYVVINTRKLSEDQIHQILTSAGHDTEKLKAPDHVYNQLMKCCQYRGKDKCTH
jgi:copper chaperone CopZ